jgi:hypothetical protein
MDRGETVSTVSKMAVWRQSSDAVEDEHRK